jgi:hypothetical protein
MFKDTFDENGMQRGEKYKDPKDTNAVKAAVAALAAYLARTDLSSGDRSEAEQKIDELKRRFGV